MAITTCIFDAYGTLFDVAAAARQAGVRASVVEGTLAEACEHWRPGHGLLGRIAGPGGDRWIAVEDVGLRHVETCLAEPIDEFTHHTLRSPSVEFFDESDRASFPQKILSI